MARNVEIKARVYSAEALAAKVTEVADSGPSEIFQDDTFFRCASGRLKLRKFADEDGELIFYRRSSKQEAKESFYLRSRTTDPDGLREVLVTAYGENGRVKKRRTVFLVGRTRVHLDDVEGLGKFIELEVILEEDEPTRHGVEEAERLMAVFGVDSSDLIEDAYADLVASGTST